MRAILLRDGQRHDLGVFEMAPGRDMDSQTLVPYGSYEKQAEHFRKRAQFEYGAPVILEPVSSPSEAALP
jgi:hypothetical protein